jgi:hypothetical protein
MNLSPALWREHYVVGDRKWGRVEVVPCPRKVPLTLMYRDQLYPLRVATTPSLSEVQ